MVHPSHHVNRGGRDRREFPIEVPRFRPRSYLTFDNARFCRFAFIQILPHAGGPAGSRPKTACSQTRLVFHSLAPRSVARGYIRSARRESCGARPTDFRTRLTFKRSSLQPPIKTLDVPILFRLARLNVIASIRLSMHMPGVSRSHLRPVIASNRTRCSARINDLRQHSCNTTAGQQCVHFQSQTLSGIAADDVRARWPLRYWRSRWSICSAQ